MVAGLLAEEAAPAAAAGANWFVQHAYVITLLPFLSAALTLFFGKRTPGKGAVYGILAIGAGLLLSLGVLWSFVQGGGNYEQSVHWFTIGPLDMQLGFYVDGLTAVMLLVVTSISLMVHIYSVGYMHDDPGYARYFAEISLFLFSMTGLVLADNYLVLYAFWEGVGVCSYLLIGFWFKNRDYTNAAKKAFVMNRIGDLGFLVCLLPLRMTRYRPNSQRA